MPQELQISFARKRIAGATRRVPLYALTAAFAASGCFLPALSVIPSVIGLAHDVSQNRDKDAQAQADADSKDPAYKPSDTDTASKPKPLTPDNVCQLMALTRPDLIVVELRKGSLGAPEYRELHLVNSADHAQWIPVVDGETGENGWRPAVNLLKMSFNPPLTDAIPDSGPCYLSYSPVQVESASIGANPAPQPLPQFAERSGSFQWNGSMYQYTVAKTLPCLSPTS